MSRVLDGARVLLVEDNPDHAELIRRAFEDQEPAAVVATAGNLREARAHLDGLPPTAVVSDLRLPDGGALDLLPSGGEALSWPVVVMTGQGTERDAVETLKRGALDYVVKSRDAFLQMPGTVARVLLEWNHRLERQLMQDALQDAHRELADAYDATIEGWSRALDLRDRETEGHARRVTDLTVRLAAASGVPPAMLVHVRRGALLHDIGKMGVPDHVLHKPGPLDEAEWELMRRHPRLAREMLHPIAYLRPAIDIPFAHHERWDGTGYPQGLAGQDIPLAARIFSVVDAWDALRSDRPYRAAVSRDEAVRRIAASAGSQFEPRLVERFLALEGSGP